MTAHFHECRDRRAECTQGRDPLSGGFAAAQMFQIQGLSSKILLLANARTPVLQALSRSPHPNNHSGPDGTAGFPGTAPDIGACGAGAAPGVLPLAGAFAGAPNRLRLSSKAA